MRECVILPVLLLASFPAVAVEAPPWERGFGNADPAEILAAVAALPPPAGGAEAEVLLDEMTVRFDDRGHRDCVARNVYRVLTQAAALERASVGIEWDPSRDGRPELRARVITADGTAHLLDPGTVVEAGAGPHAGDVFDGRRVLRAPLPAVAAGAVVEVEMVRHDLSPLLPEGDSDVVPFWGAPTRALRLRLDAPRTLPLRYAVHGIDLHPRETVAGDRRIVVFEAGPLARFERPPTDSPIGIDSVGHVQWSTGKSWADLAQGYHAIVERQLAGAEADVKELTAGIDAGAGTDAVVAALLERIEARVRYTGLEFGEAAVVPRRPAETLGRRYGDCKDLSVLLVAALRSLGIEAHLTLVAARAVSPDPGLPGIGVFNHAIVAIPGTPVRYVDPTDPGSRGAFLPQPVQGRWALVAIPASRALVELPAWRAADSRYRAETTIELPERGRARVTQAIELAGVVGSRFRAYYASFTPQLAETHRTTWSKVVGSQALVPTYEPGVPGEPFRMSALATDSALGAADDEKAVAILPAPDALSALPGTVGPNAAQERKHDVTLVPFVAEETVRVSPPPGYTLRHLPAEERFLAGPVAWTRTFERQPDGSVVAHLRLRAGDEPVLKAADAEKVRLAVRDLAGKPAAIRFERTAAALFAAGKVPEAIAEERRMVALHPREARHHLDLAMRLLDLGLGAEALAEARKAVEVEPGSATAYRTLGVIAEYDRFGRPLFPGWDRAGALASFRRAHELDPEDGFAPKAMGDVLAHGTAGRWYDEDADVEAAIAAYRSAKGEGENPVNLLFFLLQAGRFAELIEAAPGIPDKAGRSELWVAAVAADAGIEAAIAKAASLEANADGRLAVLSNAAGQLERVRHYELAAALLERIAPGAPNAHELQARAARYRKTRRLSERPAEAGPGAVFDRLVSLLIRPVPAREDVRALFATAVAEENPELELASLVGLRLPDPGDGDLPPAVWADRTSSWPERTVEGDDRFGYRVRLTGPSFSVVLFVVREGDAYRLRAWGPRFTALGQEALACLDRGDVEGARRWLAWVADAPRPPGDTCDRRAAARRVTERGAAANADELRRAAAVLAADGPVAARLDRALEARAAATDPAEGLALDQGLVFSTNRHRRGDAATAVAERLAPAFPNSPDVFWARLVDRPDPAARKALVASLRPQAERAGDVPLLDALSAAAAAAGDLDTAQAIGLALESSGRASPWTLNRLAWIALFRPGLDEAALATAIERAREATRRTDQQNRAMLHTLATLLAEAGRVREASDTLRASLALRGGKTDGSDLYVIARIAEGIGLRDEAAAAYRSVAGEPNESAVSSVVLARRRLEAFASSR